ncbi:hypothetical protein Droror1_Dr00024013 [Drosera rotundifolia]
MSVIKILTRVDTICKKYDKYNVDKLNDSSNKAEVAKDEKNRTVAVALNAEIQRTKARLMEEVPKLQRLGTKRV